MLETKSQEKPKPVCPKCKKELTYLRNSTSCLVASEFSLNGVGEPFYYHMDYRNTLEDGDYNCPNCGDCLAENEQEATEVLRGGK